MRDNRSARRYSFSMVQRIAAVHDENMPTLADFRSVQCVDLSRSGFAFHQATEPDFEELVVALGDADAPTYLKAAVMHTKLVDADYDPVYRVGCQFTGRTQMEETPSATQPNAALESAFLMMAQADVDES